MAYSTTDDTVSHPGIDPPVSLQSLTLTLAYLQRYGPSRLPHGHFLAPGHLRRIAAWIAAPKPGLRTIRNHPALAAHFLLLYLTELLPVEDRRVIPNPPVREWLHLPAQERIGQLLASLANDGRLSPILSRFGWQDLLTIDYLAYLAQRLRRQQDAGPPEAGIVVWMEWEQSAHWRFHLPGTVPDWIRFDLIQLGEWQPPATLVCHPLTIAEAVLRGYAPAFIRWLLERATGQPFPAHHETRLAEWASRATAYRLHHVHLLAVQSDELLKTIIVHPQLRSYVYDQIAPRHAVVDKAMFLPLRRWLARRSYPLDTSLLEGGPPPSSPGASAYAWLALRVLVALGELAPLPIAPPHALLADAGRALTDGERGDLEAIARRIIEELRDAIRGRDAFFPASTLPPAEWLDTITQTIRDEGVLDIHYRSLGDFAPRFRRLQPLRLESRDTLTYLYAYCYQAQKTLTFRLDRITALQRYAGDDTLPLDD